MPSRDPGRPALDLDRLSRHTGGDRDLARDLLRLFDEQCVRLLPAIATEGDDGWRADAAHTLRGGALAVGATPIAELAAEIEDSLRAGEGATPGRAALATALGRAVAEARRAIAGWREGAG